MNIVLHIGTDKTGSTAIQHALWRNRTWFQSNSVYLPACGLGWDNGHASLLQNLDKTRLEALGAELQQAKENGLKTAVLSWEGMSKYSDGEIRELLNFLQAKLPGSATTILVYLREQAQIMQSAHIQWIQMNDTALSIQSLAHPRNPAQWLKRYLFLRHPQRNYFKLLSRWKSIRPDLQFNMRVFQKDRLVDGDIVSDFLAQIGLQPNADFETVDNISNPSIAVETALLLEHWKAAGDSAAELAAKTDLAQMIIEIEGPSSKYFLNKDSVDRIRRNFRTSNEKLASLAAKETTAPAFDTGICWRTEIFTQTQRRANRLQERLDEEVFIPTLVGSASGSLLSTGLSLGTGWSSVEDWGVWSDGQESNVSFRVLNRLLAGGVTQLKLLLSGRYYAANPASELKINGKSYGKLALEQEQFEVILPVADLLPLNRVDITFVHENPASPKSRGEGEDERELAIALTQVGYEPIRPAE